ncbi:MAG TPA: hypothetical protein PKV66_04225, partial [Candidatus Pelethenecus sp.]|nr:hypothetical protein [Candidatus Pelethenecus sp.]
IYKHTMKYEYKYIDFYTDSEEESVSIKVKNDIKSMLELGWTPIYSLKFLAHTTIFFKRQITEQE